MPSQLHKIAFGLLFGGLTERGACCGWLHS